MADITEGFIANINKLVQNLEAIIQLNKMYDPEVVATLKELAGTDLDLIMEDLKKGNYLGNRKIDINLALNNQSDESECSYKSITLTMNNGIILPINFTTTTEGGDIVVEEIASYTGLYTKLVEGITAYNSNEADPQKHIVNYEIDVVNQTVAELPTMLRIRDTDGSACNIDRLTLEYYNGGSPVEYNPSYFWTKTTSALEVLANRVGDIIALGEDIDKIIALADKEDEIQYLYNVREQLQLLHDNVTKLMAVHDNLDHIVGVNENKTNIDAAAANEVNINKVAADLNLGVDSNINKAGSNINEIIAVNDNATNINKVASNENNINAAVANEDNINLVAENIVDIQNAEENAQTATDKAAEAKNLRDEIFGLDGTHIAQTLAAGSAVTVTYSSATGKFTFSVPQGAKGEKGDPFLVEAMGTIAERANYNNQPKGYIYLSTDEDPNKIYFKMSDINEDNWSIGSPFGKGDKGTSITDISFTSSTDASNEQGVPGATDTYTITLDDSSTFQFTVTNGAIPTKEDLALENVDNTSDADKPISAATQNALNLKASTEALSTGLSGKLDKASVLNVLNSTDTASALSAAQGKVLKDLINNINTLLTSDDTTLDELQEIVNYIKQNKSDLENLGISNIAGLEDALSAASLLTKIKDVDGAGSGLDADLLGGISYKNPLGIYDASYGANGLDPNTVTVQNTLCKHENCPNASYYWHIRTQFYIDSTTDNNCSQIAVQYSGGTGVYARNRFNGEWSEWVRQDNNGYATSTVGGTVKARLDETTLYLTTNGDDA